MKNATGLLLILVVVSVALTQPQSATTGVQQPVAYQDWALKIDSPVNPIPVKAVDGNWYLVYHLFLTNLSFSDMTLKSVDVLAGKQGPTLARYEDKELTDLFRFRALLPTPQTIQTFSKSELRQLPAGRTGILFFWLSVNSPRAIPSTLWHRFTFEHNPLIKLRHDSELAVGNDRVLRGF